MNMLSEDVYNKVLILANKVKENLKKQGVAIPTENHDGSVQIGKFLIFKNSNGFYTINDNCGEIIVNDINLPQTAAIIANDLALGRLVNQDLLETDREYGFALFEEALYRKIINRKLVHQTDNFDRYDLIQTKFLISKSKKESHRTTIVRSFEKLRRLV